MNNINQRKVDHVNLVAESNEIDRNQGYFDSIQLTHRALPELSLDDIDTSIDFMGNLLSFPLLISSMTGGSDKILVQMNQNLAQAAEAESVALGVGSQRVLLTDDKSINSFDLRKFAPHTLLFSNIGAVQLNYGIDIDHCRRVVDVLGADALCLHLNPLQEAVQPEGDTNFSGLASKIEALAQQLHCPIIIKEVGSGISKEDADIFKQIGVKYLDIAGSGGTSWSLVESKRSENNQTGELFKDWGIPTPNALKALQSYKNDFDLIASGGLRNGLDMVKSMILGASLCGIAKPFLKPSQESVEAVQDVIIQLKKEFKIALFLLGISKSKDLMYREDLILHEDRD